MVSATREVASLQELGSTVCKYLGDINGTYLYLSSALEMPWSAGAPLRSDRIVASIAYLSSGTIAIWPKAAELYILSLVAMSDAA